MPSDDLPLAGLWRRFAGFGLELALCVVTLGVGWLGWSAYEWRFGRTPAKRLLGMAVVRPSTGQPADWKAMALREVVYGLGIVGLFGAVTLGLGWAIGAAFVLSPSQQAKAAGRDRRRTGPQQRLCRIRPLRRPVVTAWTA